MMSRLKSGRSIESWWRGWESRPELCQVCIHTHCVSERAFYIILNLDQMAYTQWAAARGYCWTLCVHAFLCVLEHTGMLVCLLSCSGSMLVFYICALCLWFFCLCEHACLQECNSVALWTIDALLLCWHRAQFSPSQSLCGFQLLTAAGQQPAALIAQYEKHISYLCSLHLIASYSFWFMS